MPDKLGDSFRNSALVSPLSSAPGEGEPGPPILNSPLMEAKDKDGFLDEPTRPGTRRAIKPGTRGGTGTLRSGS